MREPHPGRWSAVDELALTARQSIRRFELASCLDALYAFSWSSARQLPTLAVLIGQAYAGVPAGGREAEQEDVRAWLEAMRRRVPVVDEYQDSERLDPNAGVHVFWSDRMWPLHPGLLHDPEQVMEQLRRYAAAADPVLVSAVGFGIADVVKIGLRAIAIQRAFYDGSAAKPALAGRAKAAAGSLIAFCREIREDGMPVWLVSSGGVDVDDRLRAAVDWCARDAVEVSRSSWLLGGALLVRLEGALLPVPAALVLDALVAMGAQLLELAGRTSNAVTASLLTEAEHVFAVSARGLATHFLGPVRCSWSGQLTGVMFPAARRLVAVQVAVGTTGRETAREADRARRRLAAVKPGQFLASDGANPSGQQWAALVGADSPLAEYGGTGALIAEGTVVRRVVIVDGPWSPSEKIRAGAIFVSLEQWRQIAAGVGDDHEEFWAFLDELAELPGLRMVEYATPLDLWETFQHRGILFDGSTDQQQQSDIDVHGRWRSRAVCDPYEIVLRRLGLPGLRDWSFAGTPAGGCLTVGQTTPYQHVVISASPPLAFRVDADVAHERLWTQTLGEMIHAGLAGLSTAPDGDLAAGWRAWTTAIPDPILIVFHALPPDAEHAVRLLATDGTTVWFGYRPPAGTTVLPVTIHQQLGEALWCLLVGVLAEQLAPDGDQHIVNADLAAAENDGVRQAGETFQRAWLQLPVTTMFLGTASAGRPATGGVAASISDGARARAQRAVTDHLLTRAQETAAVDDPDQFLHETAIETAVEFLQHQVSRFAAAPAARTAAVAVERLWASRTRTDDDRVLRRALGLPTDSTVDDLAQTNIVASRAADLLTETLLGQCPDVGLPMDHRDWHHLFNIAAILVDLLGRRDHARAGLSFDGRTDPSARDLPFYAHRYTADLQLTHDTRHGRSLLHEAELDPAPTQGTEDERFVSWTEAMHSRANAARKSPLHRQAAEAGLRANQIFGEAHDTGCDEIFAVLAVASSWEATTDAAEIRVADLVETVRTWSGLQPQRLHRAVDLLTLRRDTAAQIRIGHRPTSPGERFSGRPLLPVPGWPDQLLVMPRRTARAAQLLLGYLQVARLPWPDNPAAVVNAFKDWEQREQKAFEADVEREARAPHRTVIPRLKPDRAQKLGITIPGEIDLVAIDPERRRVFVVEAKASHVATDSDRVLYDIIDYHGAPASGHERWDHFRPQRATPYLPKLTKKAAAINDQLSALLSAHGLGTDIDGWTVCPMVVTPSPVPAAYVPQPVVPFATIDDLAQILADPDTPHPGPSLQVWPCTPPAASPSAPTNASAATTAPGVGGRTECTGRAEAGGGHLGATAPCATR
ncbi:hypothetical protein E0H26_21135 [Micromonospora zingiberis]|uniref:Uncharacterized protein n=1 Tax=Micromonospora zingiberis TaxID=2053011 RepID=A0A4R0GE46_9ACTN|nr:hypothetical protein [Micromonospora zingiberis]TCB94432.1 hypothetical protein E0H26_21135 [Micromonospora zingiberis]